MESVSIDKDHECCEHECSICQEKAEAGEEWKRLPCGHTFHGDCILPWVREHNTCPVCRAEVPQLRHLRLFSCAPENKQEGDQESTVPASSPQMPFVWPSEKVSSAGAGGGGGDIPPVDPRPE